MSIVVIILSASTPPLELFPGLLFGCLITSLFWKECFWDLPWVFEICGVCETPPPRSTPISPSSLFSSTDKRGASDKGFPPFRGLSLAFFSAELFHYRTFPLHPPGHFQLILQTQSTGQVHYLRSPREQINKQNYFQMW